MAFRTAIATYILLVVCFTASTGAEQIITDPYQILRKHYEAIGGLDMIKAQKKIYTEGEFSIVGTELKGTFKNWIEKPLKMRQEVDLTFAKMVVGDNGEFSWSMDPNGKILIHRDENTVKGREVRGLMENYEHLDPKSEHFALSYQGLENVNGENCYVVTITNRIDETILRHYYSTTNFYLMKKVSIEPDREEQTIYSDHRWVDGVIVPFCEIVEILPTGEKRRIEHTKYEFNLETDPSIFEPPHEDIVDYKFVNGESAEGIRVEFIEDHIYLPVMISGKEHLWVLDSGASVSVIDSGYAAEMGLEFQGPIKGQGASGIVNLYYVTLPSYTLRGIRFNEQKVMAIHMRNLFQRFLGLEVVGILGYDFLSRFTTKIDYANEEISFYHPDRFEYRGNGEVIDSPLDDNHMFSLPMTVDKIYSGKWRLDIGASGLDFHYPYASDHNLLGLKGIDAIAAGAAGEYKVRLSQFNTVELDGFEIENPLIGVPHQEGKGSFAERSLVGNVGNSFLRHFVLYLDYKNQKVIVEKGDDYDHEFPRQKSGLQLWYNTDGDIEVLFVSPNTPADEAGFKKGDVIKEINGIYLDYFDGIISIRKLLREEAGTTYLFTISRDGKLMEITLTLRDLY